MNISFLKISPYEIILSRKTQNTRRSFHILGDESRVNHERLKLMDCILEMNYLINILSVMSDIQLHN